MTLARIEDSPEQHHEALKGSALFHDVVRRTGLAPLLGPGTVRRALAAVGVVAPDHAKIGDYLRALPELRARMSIYLDHETTDHRIRQLEVHLKHVS